MEKINVWQTIQLSLLNLTDSKHSDRKMTILFLLLNLFSIIENLLNEPDPAGTEKNPVPGTDLTQWLTITTDSCQVLATTMVNSLGIEGGIDLQLYLVALQSDQAGVVLNDRSAHRR